MESSALVDPALGPGSPAMLFHDTVDNRQADAGSREVLAGLQTKCVEFLG